MLQYKYESFLQADIGQQNVFSDENLPWEGGKNGDDGVVGGRSPKIKKAAYLPEANSGGKRAYRQRRQLAKIEDIIYE